MQAAALTVPVLAAILLLPLGAGAAVDLEIEVPAQAGSNFTISNATWIFASLGPAAQGDFTFLQKSPGTQENHTRIIAARGNLAHQVESQGQRIPLDDSGAISPFSARLQFARHFGSIYLEALGANVTIKAMRADLFVFKEDSCVADALEGLEDANREARFANLCPKTQGPVLVLRLDDSLDPPGMRVEAAGVQAAEWHDMAVSCQPSDPQCPAGGQHNVTTSESPAYNLSFSTYGYTRTSSNHMGMLAGSAQPRLVMVGGANLDVAVDGWVRLPIGGDSTPCSCGDWDGKTLGATGQIRLANLRYTDDRHLGADLSGEFASARLNEQPLDVAWLNSVQLTAGVAAAAIGLVVLAKLAKLLPSGFFTRQTRVAPLDNPRRKAIHDAVLAHPGISFRGLVRLTGQAIGTTQHHLAVLAKYGLIAKRRQGMTLRFFENHGRHDKVWRELAALYDPRLKALHEWLGAQPELPQQIILDAMQKRHHWPRSTTQHRLSRLEQGGLVQLRLAGRRRYYLAKRLPHS